VAQVSETPSGLVDKLVSVSISILIATIALSCAASLLKSALPVLIPVVGGVALVWVGVAALRVWRERG